jgi:hypothetical protein
MNSYARLLPLYFIALIISACSGIQVSQDFEQGFDFSSLKTFAWESNENIEWGLASDNELVDRRIRSAVENNPTARQYSQVDSGRVDFLVLYNVVVEQRISSSNVSGGVSMGRSSRGRHGSIGISTGSQVRTYEHGTLMIDSLVQTGMCSLL